MKPKRKRIPLKQNYMPRQEYVVQYNETTDLYLIGFTGQPTYANSMWGSPSAAIVWDTLAEAQAMATSINSGTVGTTKPS